MKKYNIVKMPDNWKHVATVAVQEDDYMDYEDMIESLSYLISADKKELARLACQKRPDLDDIISVAYRLKRYQRERERLIMSCER